MLSQKPSDILCPSCGSQRFWRDGLRYPRSNGNAIQRYVCRECGYRFSETSINKPDTPEHVERVHTKKSYRPASYTIDRRVSVALAEGTKNLAEVESRTEKRAAGATVPSADVKGKLVEFTWHLKKNGYNPTTIRIYSIWLRILVKRGANLLDSESVKEVIALQERWTQTTKANAVAAYKTFTEFLGISWKPPKYAVETKVPFIPLESELDALIAASGKKTAAILQLLKETGMRIGEARRLCWTDADLERLIVTVNNPEKRSNPRAIKISAKLAGMINLLPRNGPRVFGNCNENTWRHNFMQTRKRIAAKLQNPRLEQITFHTFRHWKGTMEYHRTKDPYHVKNLLGHKSLRNTELYINLENAIFQASEADEFHVKVAEKPEEIKELLAVGFEYVCEKDGLLFFRKRK